ncbi:MAG: DegT/DnrJ/EryC1/StrS family aminotransferase [Candidatus Omnitrophica bacterium]|nr:DegT/DnrJ/EryC1/StrS family aminotransferase [Candidatus Omnitrophota bacterium]
MMFKIPIISSSIEPSDIAYAFAGIFDAEALPAFAESLSKFYSGRDIFLLDSGVSCLEVILRCLKEDRAGNEVIIPAYAPMVIIDTVLRCGLKPVLCDISVSTFNCSYDLLLKKVSEKTLLVLAVHMFGMTMEGIDKLRALLPAGVYLVEDCAQSMGSSFRGKQSGTFSDASFFSFGRGKNISLCAGGFIASGNKGLSGKIKKYLSSLKAPGGLKQLFWFINALSVTIVVNPRVYGLMHSCAKRFKEKKQYGSSGCLKLTPSQSRLGLRLFLRRDDIFLRRYENGTFLLKNIEAAQGLVTPVIEEGAYPVFNRLPVIFNDPNKLDFIKSRLWDAGIESSSLYDMPLHHIFNLGYNREDFPMACFLARGLLTLPIYPGIKIEYLIKAAEVIKKYAGGK